MIFLKPSATCQGNKIGLKGVQYGLNATIALLVLTGIGSGLVDHNPRQGVDQVVSASASISESPNLTASREISTVSAVTLVPTAQISGNQYKTTIWLNMRSGAGFNYSVIGSGVTGTTVTATGKVSGVWYQVKMGSKTGWMSSEYLSKVSATPKSAPAPAPAATNSGVSYVTTIWLNMRSGPSFNNAVIGAGPTGTTVTGTGKTSSVWLEVKMGNQIGWMSSDYLRATSGANSATALKAFAASKLGNAQQAQCLNTLWERESNWNYRAINPAFSPRQANIPEYQAYGIAQAAPGSKMASAGADWKTNPRTQITWGISYIKGRYGNPCSALTFHTIRGWY